MPNSLSVLWFGFCLLFGLCVCLLGFMFDIWFVCLLVGVRFGIWYVCLWVGNYVIMPFNSREGVSAGLFH